MAAWLYLPICVWANVAIKKQLGGHICQKHQAALRHECTVFFLRKFSLSLLFSWSGLSMTSRLITDWPVIMNQVGQCQAGSVSLSPHISISEISPSVSIELKKKEQTKAYLALSAEINFRPRREKETVFGTAWLHFLPQWAPEPQRDTKMDLHATRYSLLPAANLLLWQVSFPNSNLEDFSNLNGACRRSGDT